MSAHVAVRIPRKQFAKRVNLSTDMVTVQVPVAELPSFKGELVAQARAFLTEENTDRLIAWLDERIDFPGPDPIVARVLDAMLPGLLLAALDAVAHDRDRREPGDADIPPQELEELATAEE